MNSVTEKMNKLLGKWGPYSKKYSGISRIVDHENEDGVRFDLVVSPAIENADSRVPNVTVPTGVHPWEAKSDYSFYSYRYDLEWKDRVYADVSFTKLDSESVLVRTEFVNNTDIIQICLLNLFSAIEYPNVLLCTPVLPPKSIFIKALDYKSYEYNTDRPWDRQTIDAMKKGEFFDDGFTYHRGLGDRSHNRYILPPFAKLGEEKGDRIVYEFDSPYAFSDPVLTVRYRTTDNKISRFTLNGESIVFPAADDMGIITVPFKIKEKNNSITLISEGGGGIEFDFFAVTEKGEDVTVKTEKHNCYPQIEISECDGKLVSYKYDGVSDKFYVKTFNSSTRCRDFDTGCLEDSPTARISQPDESFQNMLETFSGSFSEKHSDEGFYHNTVVHTLYVQPHTTHTEYAVISYGKTDYKSAEDYEKIYSDACNSLEQLELTDAGKKYELSNKILRATVFQNVVYPLYRHGEYVLHHTPGKRWDSFYTWDSGFIGLDMLEFAPTVADYILDTYLSTEDNPDYAFLLHGSPVPVHIYQYLEMLKRAGDKRSLLAYYDRVKLFYDFLAGKINGSTTAKFKSGLTTTFDYFYNCSGMDDLPPQKEMYRLGIQKYTTPVISSCQVIRCAKILYMAADLLGKEDDKNTYLQDISRISDALQKYSWDENSGYFSYVIHNGDGEYSDIFKTEQGENLNKTMDGIYPIIAGAVTPAQRDRILGHLKSDDEMFSSVGISAVDKSASYYITNGYWNGNVWFSHQWFVWKTMLDLGETDFAFKIAETALNAWKREVEYSYYTFEMLNITSGRGGWFHNFGGLSTPINIWTNAYFKPKTLSSGFDVMVMNQKFNDDASEAEFRLKYYGNNEKYSLIAVMNDKKENYEVYINGKKADFVLRNRGLIEITLSGTEKDIEIKIK
ncbi:MAG: hypothetical protein J1F23_02900 [Oscillospiraceae bacterium]|nr:hypothetical protein [Oscillospiraceae bacterium]